MSRAEMIENLKATTFKLGSSGFVRLVDVMGEDSSIVQAARVSYGTGTKKVSDDTDLIRYLLRHRHTTPFEMCEVKLHIRIPMDAWRQFIRHRTACLAGDTILSFDDLGKPSTGNYSHVPKRVSDFYEEWISNRSDSRCKYLRMFDESTGEIMHTEVTDIWESGVKPVYKANFSNGGSLRASADHLCYTSEGWLRLEDAFLKKVQFYSAGKRLKPQPFNVPFTELDYSRESWKGIVGYESLYEVSSLGRIRSYVRCGRTSNRISETPSIKKLTQTKGKDSRVWVSLSTGGATKVFLVSHLVLESFVGPRPEGLLVCHADGNSFNNREENLYYGTHQNNHDDRMEQGGSQDLTGVLTKINSYESDGMEMTYDLSVKGPYHNFIAGGVVVHNSVNEYSTRYSEAIDDRAVTDPKAWRLQSESNKQGSSGLLEEWPEDSEFVDNRYIDSEGVSHPKESGPGEFLSRMERDFHHLANNLYKERLSFGVAREQARKDLPLSTYTEAYWKCDLHNIFHFLGLRMDSHAQLEIREYANVIGEQILSVLFPIAWKAFLDYRFNAVTLSAVDIRTLQHVLGHVPVAEYGKLETIKAVAAQEISPGRELTEFVEKWKRIVGYTEESTDGIKRD